jgi:glycosyltransferase involved in cell wall biosynthesis
MEDDIRIAVCRLLAGFYPQIGGISNHSYKLSKCLAQRNIPLSVLSCSYKGYPKFEQVDGFEIHRMPVLARSVRIISTACYSFMGLLWLIRHQSKYNILQCHSLFSSTTLGIVAKKLTKGKKLVVTIHMADKFSEVEGLKQKRFPNMRIKMLSVVDHFVTVNSYVQEELKSIGIPQSKICHIPNGVIIPDEASYDPAVKQKYRSILGLNYKKIVVYVGRLSSEKNLDTLLYAWKQIHNDNSDAHLLILGTGGGFRNVEAETRQLADDLMLNDSVHFIGHVDNVTSYLLAADIFALISSSEGMSNALLEAMASGIGIIASNIPGNAYLIYNERDGLLVEPRDTDRTAKVLNRLLKDHTLAEGLGKSVRQKAILEYSIDSVADRYIEVYKRIFYSNETKKKQL